METGDLIDSVVVGHCLNGNGPQQFPDHAPLIVKVKAPASQFSPKDVKTYNWNKLRESDWQLIEAELLRDFDHDMDKIFDYTANELMSYYSQKFLEIRDKYLKCFYKKIKSQPFFDTELKSGQSNVKRISRQIGRAQKAGHVGSDSFKSLKEELESAQKDFGKKFDKKRANYFQDLAKEASNSDSVETVIKCLKQVRGENVPTIPIIEKHTGDSSLPLTKEDSLNNMALGFASVGHSKQSEYTEEFYTKQKEGAEKIREFTAKVGSKEWVDEAKKLNVTRKEIKKIIKNYKKTSGGPDEITISFVQNTQNWSSLIIQRTLELSLERFGCPEMWRLSNIVPLLKDPKKSHNSHGNYRPISLTSIVARISEKVILKRLQAHVVKNKILKEQQFGGRAGRGGQQALMFLHNSILTQVEEYGVCHTIFLDIKKAFDRVDVHVLTQRLLRIGIPEVIVWWLYTFLSCRRQRVKIGDDASDWVPMDIGIPQGTVVGTMLFLLFVNTCPCNSEDKNGAEGAMFIDDIAMFGRGSEEAQKISVQKQLDELWKWSLDWGIDFNILKTEHVCFVGKSQAKFHLNGQELKRADHYKYLGVFFSKDLTFDYHLEDYILPRVSREIGYLKTLVSAAGTLRCTFARGFWMSKLQPILEYGGHVWRNSVTETVGKKLDKLQCKFLKSLAGLPQCTPNDTVLVDFAIQKISTRIESNKIKEHLKMELGLSPEIVRKSFEQLKKCKSNLTAQKSFSAPTKEQSVAKRQAWVESNTDKLVPNQHDPEWYKSLGTPRDSRHGYFRTYPQRNKGRIKGWFSRIKILTTRKHEAMIDQNTYESVKQNLLLKLEGRPQPHSREFFMQKIKESSKEWAIQKQMRYHLSPRGGKYLSKYKALWYKDTLPFDSGEEGIRQYRHLRLGVSRLKAHVSFLNHNDVICECCTLQVPETETHYFLECPQFNTQREALLNGCRSLGLTRITVKTLLGFNDSLLCKLFEKRNRSHRKKIRTLVLGFIKATGRLPEKPHTEEQKEDIT